MHTQANRTQFEMNGATIIHTPTGAEFTPQGRDSVIVWTGDIGQKLPSGDVYRYADVLDVMNSVGRDPLSPIRADECSVTPYRTDRDREVSAQRQRGRPRGDT